MDPATTPVIVAVGEYADRPNTPEQALEPVDLMVKALQACDLDAGAALLQQVTSLNLIGLVSWRYRDPVTLLCERLGIGPTETSNASMGGETPVRLIHEAALRIAKGEPLVVAIAGGEASHARGQARKARATLPWTPAAPREETVRFPSSRFAMSPVAVAVAVALGITDPPQIYPLYEVATQAAWGETPAQGRTADARLWSRFAAIAAENPSAWIQTAPDADTIAAVGPDNRMIAWPYPKLMVANPSVNQSAAIIVTSLERARAMEVAEEKLIHIWGGAHAVEPEDYLQRDRYDRSAAQEAVLGEAVAVAGGDPRRFDRMELYSCFPVVPRMAMRVLGLDETTAVPTVTGGLTFFGGPLNNYMSHAVAAMVRTLRAHPDEVGLLYGQGGYVNKHQTLVVSTVAPPASMSLDPSVQSHADAAREVIPPLAENYAGPATIETYTVTYARDGEPLQGVVIARTPADERVMARIPASDHEGIALLTSLDRSAVGVCGHVRTDVFGKPVWSIAERIAAKPLRFARVEREGPLTIVTIDRPEAMNALHPDANAELATIFDAFAVDPDQWVAILTGAGDRAFSAGNDLKETARRMARGEPIETPTTGFAGLTARFDLDKPVIAAVNGVAMGGGFEIALACDLIVAAEHAVFALPEPRVGLAALAGGLHRLPRQIGLKRAMGMILTGRRVDAQEGRELGFVHSVVPQADLMAAARALAATMLELSPMSLRASKQVVRHGLDQPDLATAYREQDRLPAIKALFRSKDSREGPLAFAQKRPPRWTGR
ncbi:enoyl-CoA hydratase-related protein [uncultured Sphingomonas sp.]|uniref:enoyl-CoA hydratase-related protein n=1 Tax=uncultured Sphingomonas sp. TaxID=158754 RepID=UPI0035CC5ECE